MQLPIGCEADFEGVFDLVQMKAITWNGEVLPSYSSLCFVLFGNGCVATCFGLRRCAHAHWAAIVSCLCTAAAVQPGCDCAYGCAEQELGASFETTDAIPAGMEEEVKKYREILLEAAVELDDDIMEAYLEVSIA